MLEPDRICHTHALASDLTDQRRKFLELLIVAVLGGVGLAIVLMIVIWKIVSSAVENGLDWVIHNFGNERAAKRVEEKWKQRGLH